MTRGGGTCAARSSEVSAGGCNWPGGIRPALRAVAPSGHATPATIRLSRNATSLPASSGRIAAGGAERKLGSRAGMPAMLPSGPWRRHVVRVEGYLRGVAPGGFQKAGLAVRAPSGSSRVSRVGDGAAEGSSRGAAPVWTRPTEVPVCGSGDLSDFHTREIGDRRHGDPS